MKKILVGLTACVFAATALVGCGKQPQRESREGVDYTFAGHEIGEAVYVKVVDAGLGSEWIDALAAAYYEETGIVVETSADPQLVTSVETKMGQTGNEKEDLYFVAQGNSNWLDWTNKNKIAAIDDVVASEKYGTPLSTRLRDNNLLRVGKYNDSTYMIPYIYSNWGLIYNQAYLDKIESLGEYTKGEWPKTMQGLIDLCAATKQAGLKNSRTGKTVEPFSCGLTVNYMNYLFQALWAELDGEGFRAYLDQSDKSRYDASEFNSPEVRRVFETLYDLIGATSSTESNLCSNAEDHLASQTNFVNGNCVFTFSGVWFETEMKKILNSVGLTTYHYGSYPVMESGNPNKLLMNIPGEFFFIPSDAENVWGAKDFLAFCTSEKGIAAAERKLSMPLAYTTNEAVEYSQFGKEILDIVESSEKVYWYSDSDIYKTGATRLFQQDTSPFLRIAKNEFSSSSQAAETVIVSEIAKHNELWEDYMKHI